MTKEELSRLSKIKLKWRKARLDRVITKLEERLRGKKCNGLVLVRGVHYMILGRLLDSCSPKEPEPTEYYLWPRA